MIFEALIELPEEKNLEFDNKQSIPLFKRCVISDWYFNLYLKSTS